MSPSPSFRLALAATAALAVAGCIIATSDRAGEPCQTRDDCDDPFYDCIATVVDGPTTCQVRFPPAQEAPDAGDAGTVGPVYWCTEIQPLMEKSCSACHGEDRSAAGNLPFRLDRYEDNEDAGLTGAKTKATRIKARAVDFQDMPPKWPDGGAQIEDGGALLSAEERALIDQWVKAGAPFCADGGM